MPVPHPGLEAARAIATRPKTYDDLLTTPDDGRRYEVHDGELIVAASPDLRHQDVVLNFVFELRPFVRQHVPGGRVYVAPLNIRVAPHNIYQSDIIYVSPARLHILREKMPVEGAPDLVVEVLSPSTRTYDRRQKAAVYARSGVLEFWVLDPDAATIEVFALRGDAFEIVAPVGGRAASLVLPGFTVDAETVFADIA